MEKVARGRPIYLDKQSTTLIDPHVADAIMPHLEPFYGNVHSRTHSHGWEAEKIAEDALAAQYGL